MALLSVSNVRVDGISACVPQRIIENSSTPLLSADELDKYMQATGIYRRHCAIPDGSICSSDLCYASAKRLITELKWNKSDIELLIFVSQTQDYKLPATSCLLQDRLGLSKDCMSFDISYGCAGFVYGLSVIGSILSSGHIKRGLLLVGNTQSFYASPEDKAMSLLFGDAGTAMALSYDKDADEMHFVLHSDGSGKDLLMVPDGGSRNPVNEHSFIMEEFEDGIRRTRLHEKMDGLGVFSFGLTNAPIAYRELCAAFNISQENIDYLCLHQANKFLCEKIRKKLKFSPEQVPYNLNEYGNTSGATIPLLMVTELQKQLEEKPLELACIGFGVGLSWGVAHFKTKKIVVPNLLTL